MNTRWRNKTRRRGAAAVEMAVVLPVLMLFLLGIIEFGWLFHVKQSLLTATRIGARTGTLPGTVTEDIENDITTAMTDFGFPQEQYQWSWNSDYWQPTPEEPFVTVTMWVDYENVSLVGGMFSWLNIGQIRSQTSYRAEVVEGEGEAEE